MKQVGNVFEAYTYWWQKLIALKILCAFAVRMAFIETLILKQPLKHSCFGTVEEFENTVALN